MRRKTRCTGDEAGLSHVYILKTIPRIKASIALVPINNVKPHEQTIYDRIKELVTSITERGYYGPPILLDDKEFAILDGHHRVEALRALGAKWVPALLVDYWSPAISLTSWRKDVIVTKSDVVKHALTGQLFPPKTTRHIVGFKLPHIKLPLTQLKKDRPSMVVYIE